MGQTNKQTNFCMSHTFSSLGTKEMYGGEDRGISTGCFPFLKSLSVLQQRSLAIKGNRNQTAPGFDFCKTKTSATLGCKSSTEHHEISTDSGLLEIYTGHVKQFYFHIPGSCIS